ncbi:hypothetical protein AURANDRAFT_39337 [Aureococcus anophagefferens]|uniref:EGF-like domain-containing protein n=1 Tax=Aureococcus anophagefferens TaxID=44056 RepID=F0YN84_AURAN|nr:hypothetical protein AURANDRAFT_39337 [Aureococcus anophagefferens]EGB03430.1 hypothetical protein AURANDRAFT_39337 [Aureococcus anophagefferens]|eukprot:XP_009041901.1 hypothetical protein AURANDRAFT_39337 [Aureococcus anophagefferens]
MRPGFLARGSLASGAIIGVLSQSLPQLLSMPCPNLCSGRGWCDSGDRRCQCYAGYTGADCSLRTCPSGPAWADEADAITESDVAHSSIECSRRGLCETSSGKCICAEGWEGAACERKSCPNECSLNGRCVSMKYFATTPTPNDALRWDFEAIRGCKCNSGYTNYDCSGQLCPYGDDPLCAWQRELTLLVGTKEWEECSGRGLCSRETGVCACFSGYGSSDGQNNPGPYEDCGYVLPAVEAMAEFAGVVA